MKKVLIDAGKDIVGGAVQEGVSQGLSALKAFKYLAYAIIGSIVVLTLVGTAVMIF